MQNKQTNKNLQERIKTGNVNYIPASEPEAEKSGGVPYSD